MSGSQKSRDDLAKFRRVSFRFVDAAPRKASKGVSDFASAKALLDVQPERHLKLTSALTIWPKFTSLPEPSLNPVSTSFSIEWVDHAYFKDHSIRGTLETVDAAAKDGLWQEWLDWLTIAGDAVELCKIPQGCSESLPLVPHPLNRWLYLVHEFVAPGLFTWGLTPSQLNDWQQRCNEVGFGEIHQTEVDSHGTRSYWLGAAAGERLRVEGLYSLQELPASFHVCSEIQNVIYESRKVLSVLEPKPIQPDGGGGASESQHETSDLARPIVVELDDSGATMETTASAPNTPPPKEDGPKETAKIKERARIQQAAKFLNELLASGRVNRATVQRRTVELLIEYDGRLPIRDLANEDAVKWLPDDYDNNTSSLLSRNRLKRHFTGEFGIRTDQRDIVVWR
jgi:hypothetical protein